MMETNDTRLRFLRAIAARVPAERIAEIHFFQPIRQGGIESGVAVVVENSPPSVIIERIESGDVVENQPGDVTENGETEAIVTDAVESAGGESQDVVDRIETGDIMETVDSHNVVESNEPAAKAPPRVVVHTARYRHTLKGPSRGAWETSIVAEADAPLITVEAVVRGVQRRAGDMDDPSRMDGNEIRALLNNAQGERTNTAGAPVVR